MGIKQLLLLIFLGVLTGCNVPTGSDSDFKLAGTKLGTGSALSTTVDPGTQLQLSPVLPSSIPSVSPTTSTSTPISKILSNLCPNANACVSKYMPLLDQKDLSLGSDLLPNGASGSQLCGPVSGTMVLAAYLGFRLENLPQINVQGWTSNSFKDKSWQVQVKNMATLMATSPTEGTLFYPNKSDKGVGYGVAGRQVDFTQGMVVGTTSTIGLDYATGSNLISLLKAGNLIEVMSGNYTGTTYKALGFSFKSFARNSGHLMALSGWSNGRLVINDPWGGKTRYTSFGKIYLSSDNNVLTNNTSYYTVPAVALPYSLKDTAFFLDTQQGNDFDIIEGYSMISMIPPN